LSFCDDGTQWAFVSDKTLKGKAAVHQWMVTECVEPPLNIIANLIAERDFVTAQGDVTLEDEYGNAAYYSYCDVWLFRDGKMLKLKAFVIEAEVKDEASSAV
jgi:uncharacterized protein